MTKLALRLAWPAALAGGIWGFVTALLALNLTPWLWVLMVGTFPLGMVMAVRSLGRMERDAKRRLAKAESACMEAKQNLEVSILRLEAALGLAQVCDRCKSRRLGGLGNWLWQTPSLNPYDVSPDPSWRNATCEDCGGTYHRAEES